MKAVALVVLTLALVLVLAACGGDGNSDENAVDETTTAEVTTDVTTTDAVGEDADTRVTETEDEDETETEAGETTAEAGTATTASGDVAAGMDVFVSAGCGSCHTVEAAGTTGTVGPELDSRVAADAEDDGEPLDEFVRDSIVEPDDYVAEGFQEGVMPDTYEDQLSETDLDNLVAFVVDAAQQ